MGGVKTFTYLRSIAAKSWLTLGFIWFICASSFAGYGDACDSASAKVAMTSDPLPLDPSPLQVSQGLGEQGSQNSSCNRVATRIALTNADSRAYPMSRYGSRFRCKCLATGFISQLHIQDGFELRSPPLYKLPSAVAAYTFGNMSRRATIPVVPYRPAQQPC